MFRASVFDQTIPVLFTICDDPVGFIVSVFFLKFLFYMHETLLLLQLDGIPEKTSAFYIDVILYIIGVYFCCVI